MARLGALLCLFGFGSAVLHFTDFQFKLLMWSEPMQPALGLGLGGAGVVFAALAASRNKDREPDQPADPGYGPPQPGFPATPAAGFTPGSPQPNAYGALPAPGFNASPPPGMAPSVGAGFGAPPPAGYRPQPTSGFSGPPPGVPGVPGGFGAPMSPSGGFPAPPQGAIPVQGQQFGPRPPLGPPAPRAPQGPPTEFGPSGGQPFGPQGQ